MMVIYQKFCKKNYDVVAVDASKFMINSIKKLKIKSRKLNF